ncbi:MAG: pantoate kinase [Candidatus Hadarchaeaceae archaeon]|nr:kinase [Hadesarchaea archaeon]MDH5685364.1 kinase [Hadesarchaea archaeon]
MRKASAFVPAHISGFFQVCEASDTERMGSRNCGPCLDIGVLTEVKIEPATRTSVNVLINNKRTPAAKTTLAAIEKLLDIVREPLEVKIAHSCQVPIGAGYGASGAGALGAVLALSKALGLRLQRERLATIAHVAEVTCRTGLGDVGAQALGGLVIGLEPGAPPYGRWKQIRLPKDVKVVCGTLTGLPTSKLLRRGEFRERSKQLGGLAIKKLLEKPTLQNFMKVSLEFAEELGLLNDELRALIGAVSETGAIGVSQVMLGKAAFALVKDKKLEQVTRTFLEFLEPGSVIVASVNRTGARLLG